MEELGEHGYAQTVMSELTAEAECLQVGTMLTTSLLDRSLDGLRGRAWVTGRQLVAAIGWEELKPLAATFGANGRPDVAAWVRSLAPELRASVEAVLGAPSPDWV